MTSKMDVLKSWHKAAYANPPSSIAQANMAFLSDDFKQLDQQGNVLSNKEQYIGLAQLMAHSFDNFRGLFGDMRDDGDGVIVHFHFEGKHARDFDLSALGVGVIPASGKMVVWPDATARMRVEGNKIVSIQEISSGLEWFLAPLGVKLPVQP